jgi:hypothetical protein
LPVPKTTYMIEEYEKKRKKQVSFMRSVFDYGIGAVILFFGVFLFFRDQFDIAFNERFKPDVWDKVAGVMFFAYGSWRIYRGYKKNYFK